MKLSMGLTALCVIACGRSEVLSDDTSVEAGRVVLSVAPCQSGDSLALPPTYPFQRVTGTCRSTNDGLWYIGIEMGEGHFLRAAPESAKVLHTATHTWVGYEEKALRTLVFRSPVIWLFDHDVATLRVEINVIARATVVTARVGVQAKPCYDNGQAWCLLLAVDQTSLVSVAIGGSVYGASAFRLGPQPHETTVILRNTVELGTTGTADVGTSEFDFNFEPAFVSWQVFRGNGPSEKDPNSTCQCVSDHPDALWQCNNWSFTVDCMKTLNLPISRASDLP